MIDFSKVKYISTQEGKVKSISRNGVLIWQQPRLPEDYQEVAWLSAADSLGAYIKLGFTYDTGAVVRLGQWIMSDATTYPFGAAENSGKLRCMFSSPYSGSTTIYGSNGTQHISIYIDYTLNALNDITCTFKAGAWTAKNAINGDTAGPASALTSYTMTNELYLFAQNYNGSPRFGAERRISYFQYYDKTNTLICDLIPCYRKSDNVTGMYDVVRKIFLTNAGSGKFTAGANV